MFPGCNTFCLGDVSGNAKKKKKKYIFKNQCQADHMSHLTQIWMSNCNGMHTCPNPGNGNMILGPLYLLTISPRPCRKRVP